MRVVTASLIVAFVASLAFAGCGSSGDSEGSGGSSGGTAGTSGTAGTGGSGGTGGGGGTAGTGGGGTGGGGTGGGGTGGTAGAGDGDNDGFLPPDDCDDENPDIHPGAQEVCNGEDDDCDGDTDEDLLETFYLDVDGDGYGVDDPALNAEACEAPDSFSSVAGDCVDGNANINPSEVEVCNGIDDNCDGQEDEGVAATLYIDGDGDGYGVDDPATNIVGGCPPVQGYAELRGDCDDTKTDINPGMQEIDGNSVDENCDGTTALCFVGIIECDNNVMRRCDANGYWEAPQDCGSNICNTQHGCVLCSPFGTTCQGNTQHSCAPDGSGWIDTECDPLVGSTCENGYCTGPCAPSTLGQSYIGCDYYPTVTVNSALREVPGFMTIGHYAVAVSNTSSNTATVTITQGASTVASQDVPAGSVAVIQLPWNALRTAPSTQVFSAMSYRLRSTQPVTVYQFNPLEYQSGSANTYTNDASLLVPVTAWRDDYVVVSRQSWPFGGTFYPGFYAVVASEDGTTVTVTPSPTSRIRVGAGLSADGAGTVTLDAGDVLQVLSGNNASHDLTGTRIASDKPVQVISGHDCTYIPASTPACDHLEESMFPVVTLANEYIVSATSLPGQTNPKAVFTRVVALEPNTTLTYEPANAGWPSSIAQAGGYIEIDSASEFQVTASDRVIVSQYMKGQDAGGGAGDPAMAIAVTTPQFRNNYLFHAPVNYTYSYVNVTAPSGSQVLLDGTAVSGFAAVGNTGFSVARVPVPNSGNGNHTITSNDRFGITVYGYGSYTSYWYPGGLNLADL